MSQWMRQSQVCDRNVETTILSAQEWPRGSWSEEAYSFLTWLARTLAANTQEFSFLVQEQASNHRRSQESRGPGIQKGARQHCPLVVTMQHCTSEHQSASLKTFIEKSNKGRATGQVENKHLYFNSNNNKMHSTRCYWYIKHHDNVIIAMMEPITVEGATWEFTVGWETREEAMKIW